MSGDSDNENIGLNQTGSNEASITALFGLFNFMELKDLELLSCWHDGVFYVEEWKDIEGFEGIYSISSFGRVFTHLRVRKYRCRTIEGNIKCTSVSGSGYPSVALCNDGKSKCLTIHSLVAKYFVKNPDCKKIVNHLDEVKTNNFFKNLEWTTSRGNNIHSSQKINKYGMVGISYHNKSKRFLGRFVVDGKMFNTPYCKNLEDAKKHLSDALFQRGFLK